ncbi:DUF6777 domain-containing protein [Streptomyces sp. NPDC054841]
MFVRSPKQGRYAGPAALSAGLTAALLVTGCSSLAGQGQPGTSASQQVHLQPAADQGPDPFTPSTATTTGASGEFHAPRTTGASGPESTVRPIRTVLGSTPGLYGGTRSVASCDVEQQIRFLMADRVKGDAFTQGAGVSQQDIPAFLRGLTPVLLRADVRVTSHGYRDGTAQRHQTVLQAGTAVLVDEHGSPRVRCASGSPLASPVVTAGTPEEQGKPWKGYDPGRVVVITRAAHVIDNLMIVDIIGNAWMERKSGTDGEADRKPDVPPPYDTGTHVTEAPAGLPAGPVTSSPQQASPDAAASQPNRQDPGTDRPGVPSAPTGGPDAIRPDAILPDASVPGASSPDAGAAQPVPADPGDPNALPQPQQDDQGAFDPSGTELWGPDDRPDGGAGTGSGTGDDTGSGTGDDTGGGASDGASGGPDVILPDAVPPDAVPPDAAAPDAAAPDAAAPDAAGDSAAPPVDGQTARS